MSRGQQVFKSAFRPISILVLVLVGLLLQGNEALAYYNFGMHWKGALNPQHLGADRKGPSGFTVALPGEVPIADRNGEGLAAPGNVAIAPSGDILVTDVMAPRVVRYTSAGVYGGWIGRIKTSPTGGAAGCAGAAAGTFTPGWCIGGSATDGVGSDGIFSMPSSIAFDSAGNFYVTNGPNSIIKFNSSGVFQGWIGKISISPTGGAAGCAGAAVGTAAPGWCTGGAPVYGSTDGALYYPQGIVIDASNNIYVAEINNSRVDKFNSSGVFQGWIGKIKTSPTGGAAGCAGAAVGTFTPGWCKGGTADFGATANGSLFFPIGLGIDSTGNLYVSDSYTSQINKYNSSGAFQGWIGRVGTSPTGGVAGCAGATPGTITPGWCIGGTAGGGDGDGAFLYPSAINVDSTGNMYVTDQHNSRVSKFNSSGAFQGWIGAIGSSPTGGAAGCAGATVGTVTPGWCTGGTATMGYKDGMLYDPTGITVSITGEILVVDSSNDRVNKYSSAGAPLGALQTMGLFKGAWSRTGVESAAGWGDGMLRQPDNLTVDSSGNLFVSDRTNSRISKYTSSGTFLGWIGSIGFSPSGGAAGCAGAAMDTITPGWCLGGSSSFSSYSLNGTDGSLTEPSGVAVDSTGNMFVLDAVRNHIKKYDSNGVFIGWIGGIQTTPTGGDPGCIAASSGSFTPGWCKGGDTASGSSNGFMSWPGDLILDSSGNLLVADTYNNRISKYAPSGAFVGWIGKIATSPTGGAAGCSGATAGTITPGWCNGGTSDWGDEAGAMGSPDGVAVDSGGNIYVADTDNSRISKYSSNGVFIGWIGKIGTSPTGGATGCAGAAVGTVTPGWCTGGASDWGAGDGMLDGPYALAIDKNGTFYVADEYNDRVVKYGANGSFQGWFGRIKTSPTGGDTGCKGAAVGSVTPGWCKGGLSQSGDGNGMLDSPSDLVLDGKGYLYIADSYNNRIMRIWIRGR